MEIWKEREHKSQISGKYLGKEPLSTFFHHILPKARYPEAALDKENIILLTPDEHADIESKVLRSEIIDEMVKILKKKYEK